MEDGSTMLVGVVEGFYGRPWKYEQRRELFHLMQCWDMNAYLYAPKDDRKHRADWREAYVAEELCASAALIGGVWGEGGGTEERKREETGMSSWRERKLTFLSLPLSPSLSLLLS